MSGPAICGIQRHLPACEGPGGTEEQGQSGAECLHSILKEKCVEETVPLSSRSSSGWASAQRGKGPPSSLLPLSSCCPPPTPSPLLQLSRLHQSHPTLGGRRGTRRRGASGVSGWGHFGSCLRRSCLRLLREGAQGDVFPLALGGSCGVQGPQLQPLSICLCWRATIY